jgi:plasmid stabilization system protein ParE
VAWAFADLERIFEFIAEVDPARARRTVQRIRDAVLMLKNHPSSGGRWRRDGEIS